MRIVDISSMIQKFELEAVELLLGAAVDGKIETKQDIESLILPFYKHNLEKVLREITGNQQELLDSHFKVELVFPVDARDGSFSVRTEPLSEYGNALHEAYHSDNDPKVQS